MNYLNRLNSSCLGVAEEVKIQLCAGLHDKFGLKAQSLTTDSIPRITGGMEWDFTYYNGKGGSHVAAVDTHYVVYTTTIDNSHKMIK